MKFKDTDVSTHSSVDNSDPGFAIKGVKLRWVSGQVESRRAGRIWVPLKVSMLPDKTVARMKEHNPSWFSTGDTIRRKDLTLAYAPLELVEARQRELHKQQRANESVFRAGQDLGNTVKTDKDTGMAVERASAAEQFS